MRPHLRDLPAGAREFGWAEAFACWWADLPWRRRTTWRELLLEPGQGWLRWSPEERATAGCYDPPEPPEHYRVYPPAGRVWNYVRWWLEVPRSMLWGYPDRDLWPRRFRLSWEEARPSWSDCWDARDPERGWSWR